MNTIDQQAINRLKLFIKACEANPVILHDPKLAFFKEYLLTMGATVSFQSLFIIH